MALSYKVFSDLLNEKKEKELFKKKHADHLKLMYEKMSKEALILHFKTRKAAFDKKLEYLENLQKESNKYCSGCIGCGRGSSLHDCRPGRPKI